MANRTLGFRMNSWRVTSFLSFCVVYILYSTTLSAQSVSRYQVHCMDKDGPEKIELSAQGRLLLTMKGSLVYQGTDVQLQCVQHLDFSKPPSINGLDKTWVCVDERYYDDLQTAYFSGFYFVEIYTGGISSASRADISRVLLGSSQPLTSMQCTVFSLIGP